MTITPSSLVWRGSANVSDTSAASNGGAIAMKKAITTNVKNNLFPDVSEAERTVGSIKLRKVFLHVDTPANEELLNPLVYVPGETAGGDFVVIALGTDNGTEDSEGAGLTFYGCATLVEDYTALSAPSLVVEVEAYAFYKANNCFTVGDTVVVTDGSAYNRPAITSVTYNDGAETITLGFAGGFTTNLLKANTVIASVIEAPSVKASASAPVKTSAAGIFTGSIAVKNNNCLAQQVTVTFTSPSNYTVTGNTLGVLGSGNVNADTAIKHAQSDAAWFTLKSSFFSGTFAPGDTLTFTTTQAAIPLWVRRQVPAGCATISSNTFPLTVEGESL